MREGRVGVFASPAGGGDQIDFSRPVLQSAGTDAAIISPAALSPAPPLVGEPAIEACPPIGFDARALVVEHHPQRIRRSGAVDYVRDPGELVQLRGEALHLGVGMARRGRCGIVPTPHCVESQRVRFISDHLRDPVFLPDEQRRELGREADKGRFFSLSDIDQSHRQTVSIRAVQRFPPISDETPPRRAFGRHRKYRSSATVS
jgi:hypothetical protein